MASRLLKRHYASLMLVFTLQVNATDNIVTRVSSQSPLIKYGPGWANETKGRVDGVRSQFMLSNYVATATYVFNGSRIAVFGTIHTFNSNGTNTTYSVDDASPSLFTIDPSHTPQDDVQFFVSPPLTDGQHTLVIKNQNRGSWLWFEYLQVTSLPTDTPTATSGSQVSQLASSDTSHSQGISGAVITGIVIAICVFLALLGVIIFFVLRRRRSRHPKNHNGIDPLRVGPEMTVTYNPVIQPNQQYPQPVGSVPNTVDYGRNFAPATSYLIPSTGTSGKRQQQHVASQSLTTTSSPPIQTTGGEKFRVVHTSSTMTGDEDPPPY